MSRKGRILASVVAVAGFWGAAFLGMLNDIDFFSLEDLFDTTELHHEHIVVVLFALGIIAGIGLFFGERRPIRRAGPGSAGYSSDESSGPDDSGSSNASESSNGSGSTDSEPGRR